MAYTSKLENTMDIPVEPAVMAAYVTADTTELLIPIPWKNCKLVYCVACFDVAEASDVGTIDVELNAAGGGDMFSIAIAANQGSGTAVEGTIQTAADCENLDRANTGRDYVNLEVAGSAADYTCNVYLYFERQPIA